MKSLLILLVLLSCTHRNQNLADKLMFESTHEELIDKFEDPDRDQWQKPAWVLKQMGDIEGKKIIDIGSGSGYFSRKLHKKGANVTAADVDDKFLKHLRQFEGPGFTVKEIEFDDPKMNSHSFDMAFTSNTFHHIDHRVRYLKKVHKGLKAGGQLVIVDYKPSAGVADKTGPRNSIRVPILKVVDELMKAGFGRVRLDQDTLPRQYLVIGIK